MKNRVSGWIFPDGEWVECPPWAHIKAAKEHSWIIKQREVSQELHSLWDAPDEEALRVCLAQLGMVKVCYHLIDADCFTRRQLLTLQNVHSLTPLDQELEFIGRIKVKIEMRIFLKLRDPERLNSLGQFG